MIVMINGAFGSGKTSAANRLQPLIPNSMIYDPEEIGYMLRNVILDGTLEPQVLVEQVLEIIHNRK